MLLDKLIILMSQLVGPFVRSSQFGCPLLVLDCHATLIAAGNSLRLLHAFIAFTFVKILVTSTFTRQVLTKLETLSCTTEHVMQLSI